MAETGALVVFLGTSMNMSLDTPLDRARAKCDEIERELRKSPDFHLYILTTSRNDRARMERLLMEIPEFELWHTLMKSIMVATRQASAEECS
jgi:hypothetical protein